MKIRSTAKGLYSVKVNITQFQCDERPSSYTYILNDIISFTCLILLYIDVFIHCWWTHLWLGWWYHGSYLMRGSWLEQESRDVLHSPRLVALAEGCVRYLGSVQISVEVPKAFQNLGDVKVHDSVFVEAFSEAAFRGSVPPLPAACIALRALWRFGEPQWHLQRNLINP